MTQTQQRHSVRQLELTGLVADEYRSMGKSRDGI